MRNKNRFLKLACLAPVLLVISGCSGIGPLNISEDRMKYNEALQQTNDQELLVNLVRLRYHDSPSFVKVAGITAQSSLTTGTSLSLSRTSTRAAGAQTLSFANVFAPSISHTDAPVISYSPLQGDGFVREFLSPVTLNLMVFMSKSGWSLGKVLSLLVEKINFVPNAPTASGPTPEKPPEFRDFRKLINNLNKMGEDVSLDYFVIKGKSQPGIRFAPGALQTPHGKEVAKLLKLAPNKNMFFLVDNIVLDRDNVVDVRTRSLMGVLYFLSHSVAIPGDDLKAGLAVMTANPDGGAFEWSEVSKEMFRVHASPDKPENAAVTVQYRGHWFYIADNDLRTKSSFIMLSQLLALQSGSQELKAPALTLPLN